MEQKLRTIQKHHNLNEVWRNGEPGPGGAHHSYTVYHGLDPERDETRTDIKFQKGPREAAGSIGGVLDCDLLEIVRDRLASFQEGEFATGENEQALRHIEEALMWMNKRVEDRAERNVLGKYSK